MTPRIQKAIDIFLDAINNGTLAKSNCAACAVGNLTAAAIGYKPVLDHWNNQPNAGWEALFFTKTNGKQMLNYGSDREIEQAEILISKTDFSKEELMQIEYAFETNTKILWGNYWLADKEKIRADQIRGLEAVVKVMLTFDDCKDEVKEVFTKRAELIPVN